VTLSGTARYVEGHGWEVMSNGVTLPTYYAPGDVRVLGPVEAAPPAPLPPSTHFEGEEGSTMVFPRDMPYAEVLATAVLFDTLLTQMDDAVRVTGTLPHAMEVAQWN
jgi:hypothetical protein